MKRLNRILFIGLLLSLAGCVSQRKYIRSEEKVANFMEKMESLIVDSNLLNAKGAFVDEMGVELDSDGDGVPDSQDVDPNTKSGDVVNFRGQTLLGIFLTEPPYAHLPDFELGKPTDRYKFKIDQVIDPTIKTIGDLCDKIDNAITESNLDQPGYVEIPGVGIGVVTNIFCYTPENGANDLNAAHCKLKAPVYPWYKLWKWIPYKLKPNGRYRYFVFIVGFDRLKYTPGSANASSYNKLNEILENAKDHELDTTTRNYLLPNETFLEALVYEFEVSNVDGSKSYLKPFENGIQKFKALDHLKLSGIYPRLVK